MNHFLRVVIAVVLISEPITVVSQSYSITTIAGTGRGLFAGDGGQAALAHFQGIAALAVDHSGNIYIADSQNQRIRKVNAQGIIQTVAGTGKKGPGEKSLLALSTNLLSPRGLAVDNSGNFYIADTLNNMIRKVTPNGQIATVAGTEWHVMMWRRRDNFSLEGRTATSIRLTYPREIAVDSAGNLFITDWYHKLVLRVTPEGGVSVVAGTLKKDADELTDSDKEAGFDPGDIAVDNQNHLFVIDRSKNQVLRVNSSQSLRGTAEVEEGFDEGRGWTINAQLSKPKELGIDGDNNLYILDEGNARVYRVTTQGTVSTVICKQKSGDSFTYTTDCSAPPAEGIYGAAAMAVDRSGNLYLADDDQVFRVSSDGAISIVAGVGRNFTGDGGLAVSALVLFPWAVAVDKDGNLFVTDGDHLDYRVRKITNAGTINTLAGAKEAGFTRRVGPTTSARLSDPSGLGVDTGNNVYIADRLSNRILKVTTEGIISTVFGTETPKKPLTKNDLTHLQEPSGVTLDGFNNLYIADTGNNRVLKISPQNAVTLVAGNGKAGFRGDGGPATSAMLDSPEDVAVDKDGNIYISDSGNHVIRKVSPNRIITSVTGALLATFTGDKGPAKLAHLNDPGGIAVDRSGNLYIADFENNRVRRISASSHVITTIAGDGDEGFDGDGGAAAEARLNGPSDVVVDMADNVYIVDSANHRLRKLTPRAPSKANPNQRIN